MRFLRRPVHAATAAADDGQVDDVVAHEGDSLGLGAVELQELGEGGRLVRALLDEGVDLQLADPEFQGGVAPAGEDAHLEARPLS